MNAHKQITVCLFGYLEREEGGRTWPIRKGLLDHNLEVVECRTSVGGFYAKWRDLYRTWQTVAAKTDVLYVLFMGYYLMPLAWYLARRRGIPVILDALVSQYDTEVVDRRRVSGYHPRAWFLWGLDWISYCMADAIVVDTSAHKNFFVDRFNVDARNIIVVPLGCRSDLFVPSIQDEAHEGFIVEFHGSFIPLQGVEFILQAARILQDMGEKVHFEFVGDGQTLPEMQSLAKELNLHNVTFIGRKHPTDIPHFIGHADVCLGIFGVTDKALRVIPHKVFECLSSGKAVITERSPAALELLRDRDGVCMVEPGNAIDLAEKILELKNNSALRGQLGARANLLAQTQLSPHMAITNLVRWVQLHT